MAGGWMCRRPRPLLAVALLLLLACSTLSGPQRSRRWRFRSSRVRSAEKLASLEKRIVEMEKEYKTMMKTFKGVDKMVKKVFNITKKDRQLWLGAKYRANPQRDFFWDAGGKRLKFRVKGRTDGGANCVVLIMFRSPGDFATLDCQLPRYFVCEQAD